MSSQTELISKRRERVIASYKEAELINYELFHNGDDKGTSEYIFPNDLMIDMKTKNVILFSFLVVIFLQNIPDIYRNSVKIDEYFSQSII
jgi:hypothetical protein